jgi:hypothetical protein
VDDRATRLGSGGRSGSPVRRGPGRGPTPWRICSRSSGAMPSASAFRTIVATSW